MGSTTEWAACLAPALASAEPGSAEIAATTAAATAASSSGRATATGARTAAAGDADAWRGRAAGGEAFAAGGSAGRAAGALGEGLGISHLGDPENEPDGVHAVEIGQGHFHEGGAGGLGAQPFEFPLLGGVVVEAPVQGHDAFHEVELGEDFALIEFFGLVIGGLFFVEVEQGSLEAPRRSRRGRCGR